MKNCDSINFWYTKMCTGEIATSTDIFEHLPTIKKYSEGCDTIVELGVRVIVSTWAFLAGNPKKLISIDIRHPSQHNTPPPCPLEGVYAAASECGIDFEFRQENTLINEIPECDLLFIDTYHTYYQLRAELDRHANKSKKYIVMHDTVSFGSMGEDGGIGLQLAVTEFLSNNKNWVIDQVYTNNNGLTILRRVHESI